jgi:hypothetical protein
VCRTPTAGCSTACTDAQEALCCCQVDGLLLAAQSQLLGTIIQASITPLQLLGTIIQASITPLQLLGTIIQASLTPLQLLLLCPAHTCTA